MDDPTADLPRGASTLAANELRAALGWLGLAVRAGRVRLGSDAVLAAIRGGQARLVLLASDAGGNVSKKFRDKCSFYRVPVVSGPNRRELGRACGRGAVVAVAVLDESFAVRLRQSLSAIYGGEAFDETEGL
jgi:ribosomal protein L7Ae-like RNA K-turn-binding protein